jgi:hypothetical protein
MSNFRHWMSFALKSMVCSSHIHALGRGKQLECVAKTSRSFEQQKLAPRVPSGDDGQSDPVCIAFSNF